MGCQRRFLAVSYQFDYDRDGGLNSLNTSGDSGLGYLTVEGVPAAC
jgi:hypothetical protein